MAVKHLHVKVSSEYSGSSPAKFLCPITKELLYSSKLEYLKYKEVSDMKLTVCVMIAAWKRNNTDGNDSPV